MQVSTHFHYILRSVIVKFVLICYNYLSLILIILVGVVSSFAIVVDHRLLIFITHVELVVPHQPRGSETIHLNMF